MKQQKKSTNVCREVGIEGKIWLDKQKTKIKIVTIPLNTSFGHLQRLEKPQARTILW
jgi:hypothetical protein